LICPAERLLALRVDDINFVWIQISYLLAHYGCVKTQVFNQHVWQLRVLLFDDYIHLVLVKLPVDSKETF